MTRARNYKLRKGAIVNEIFQLVEQLIHHLSEVEEKVEELLGRARGCNSNP